MENSQSLSKSIIMDNSQVLSKSIIMSQSQTFIPQISLRNVPEITNLIAILENFKKQYNNNFDYTLDKLGRDNFTIVLDDESVAMNLTQFIINQINNPNTQVYMELIPSPSLIKKKKENKRKISKETIEKLYLGISPTIGNKREKKRNAFYFREFDQNKKYPGSLDLIKSAVHKDKWSSPTNFHVFQGNKASVREIIVNKVPESNPYKEPKYNFRTEDKNKWVSPTNFFV